MIRLNNTENLDSGNDIVSIIFLFTSVIIFVTAFFVTNANTIFLPAVGIFFYFSKDIFKIKFNINFIYLIGLFFLSIILFNLKFITNSLSFNIIAWGDKSFYAQVSGFINYTGIETYFFDYVNIVQRKPIPYHYGENWLSIFFSRIFKINEFYAQELIVRPILLFFSIYTIKIILSKSGYTNIVSLIISAFIVSYTGILFINYEKVPILGEMINQFQIEPWSFNKHLLSIAFISFYINSLMQNNWKVSESSVLIALFAFLSNISFFNILLTSLILYNFDKNIIIKHKIYIGLLVVFTFLYFYYFYFYKNNISDQSSYSATDLSFWGSCISLKDYLITFINIEIKSLIQISIILLPFLIYIFFKIKFYYNNYLNYVLLTFLILISGLSMWAVLWYSIGSISLFIDASYWFFKISILILFFLNNKVKYIFTNAKLFIFFNLILLIIILPNIYKILFYNEQNDEKTETLRLIKSIEYNELPVKYISVFDPNESFNRQNLLAYSSIGPISNVTTKHQGIFVDLDKITLSNDCFIKYRQLPLIKTSTFNLYLNKIPNKKDSLTTLKNMIDKNDIKYLIKDKRCKFTSMAEQLKIIKINENEYYELYKFIK